MWLFKQSIGALICHLQTLLSASDGQILNCFRHAYCQTVNFRTPVQTQGLRFHWVIPGDEALCNSYGICKPYRRRRLDRGIAKADEEENVREQERHFSFLAQQMQERILPKAPDRVRRFPLDFCVHYREPNSPICFEARTENISHTVLAVVMQQHPFVRGNLSPGILARCSRR